MKARLAFTSREVFVTPRGKSSNYHTRGFIRVAGKTVSGYVYDGGYEKVFYAEGKNEALAYDRNAA
jgi:hypothetical protein